MTEAGGDARRASRRRAPAPFDGLGNLGDLGDKMWIRIYEPLILATAVVALLMYAYWGASAPLAIGLVMGLVVYPLTRLGRFQLVAGRIEAGILSISLGLWAMGATAALGGAKHFAIAALIAVGGIIVAVPYTSRNSVKRAIVCSTAITLFAAVMFQREPLVTYRPMPEWLWDPLIAAYALACLALYALVAWEAADHLRTAMEEMRAANRALSESERDLERKVVERTAELTRSERQLALARDEALAANRAKSVFLANMSHELRTPLNAVIGYSEMLQEDAADAGHDTYLPDLERILVSGRHLLSLINDVLDLSKIEADKIELFVEEVDVDQLLRGVAATVAPAMAKNDNRLEVDCAEDVGIIQSDATRLRQILLNLLSNAAKFTSAGTVRLVASRCTDARGDTLTLEVADEGIGMSEEHQGQIFEAFSQAEATTTRDFGGTGLGLTITRRFCEMLGGDISVSSEAGKGSTFRVTVPARLVAETDASAEPPSDESGTACSQQARVLVIDEDPMARDLLERQLAAAKYEVRSASGGAEGLRLARDWRPTVILLDILMPEMDGWTVLSRLKSDSELARIPVILTSMLDEGNPGYMLGAAEYLLKPVNRENLNHLLSRYVAKGARSRVLIVDDESMSRELLRRSIEVLDMDVEEADNGRDALARIERHAPTSILLDLGMPVMDGFEFLEILREHRDWRAIPVIVVTSRDLTRDEWRRLDRASERALQKGDYATDELLSMVRKLAQAPALAAGGQC